MNTITAHPIPVAEVSIGQRLRPQLPNHPGSVVVRVVRGSVVTVVDIASVADLEAGASILDATTGVFTFPTQGNLTTFLPEGANPTDDRYTRLGVVGY